jgi:hypothetical protein
MSFSTNILRSFFSLTLLVLFLLGNVAGNLLTHPAHSPKTSTAEKNPAEKKSKEEQAVIKAGVSPEAMVSTVSIKFNPLFFAFVRQYFLQVSTVTNTDFGYPVFRDSYFARIFSHLIVTNAP